jgi:signal transduction histidine kinase/CheY-like chemotaxis protein
MTKFICSEKQASSQVSTESTEAQKKNLLTLLKETKGRFENVYCNMDDKNNLKRFFLTEAFPFVWDYEEAVILILNDITTQEQFITLREADTNKDLALSTVSHELRTPISGILGILGILDKKIKDLESYDLIQICKSNAMLLMNLVNCILDLQQIRSGKFKINKEDIDIRELANSIIPLFKIQSEQKGIKLQLEIDNSVDKNIWTDRIRLLQVLINLTGNAIKFTFSGTVKLRIRQDETQEDKIWFSVQDTGIGISEDHMENLFKIFGKLEDPQKINTQGIGLGLTISNNLVCLLNDDDRNCKILVESKPDIGTKFSFFLQKTKINKENVRVPTSESISEEPSPKKVFTHLPKAGGNSFSSQRKTLSTEIDSPRIEEKIAEVLVVDDNSFNVIIAKRMIENKGLNVVCAYHGKEAIDIVMKRSSKIKLIVMDCQMPVMDGYEALVILKEKMSKNELPKIPIYLLSAKNYEGVLQELKGRAEIDGYFMKPLTDADLRKVLKKYDLI